MYVYAVVAADVWDGDFDTFVTCMVNPVHLTRDPLVDSDPRAGTVDSTGRQRWPLAEKWFPKTSEGDERSRDLYAAVLLGTSGGTWMDMEGNSWACEREDLSEEGEALAAGLEKLYGLPVKLLTFIDT